MCSKPPCTVSVAEVSTTVGICLEDQLVQQFRNVDGRGLQKRVPVLRRCALRTLAADDAPPEMRRSIQ